MNSLKLFLIESPNPIDLLERRSEISSLNKICKLFGYDVAHHRILSKDGLSEYFKYISGVYEANNILKRDKINVCIHISSHGNNVGLALGPDIIKWSDLFVMLKQISKEAFTYKSDFILIISACGSGKQTLSKDFLKYYKQTKGEIKPPEFIFVTDEENLPWDGGLISWANFYYHLVKLDFSNKDGFKELLNKIKLITTISLKYFRWDRLDKKYKFYDAKKL